MSTFYKSSTKGTLAFILKLFCANNGEKSQKSSDIAKKNAINLLTIWTSQIGCTRQKKRLDVGFSDEGTYLKES